MLKLNDVRNEIDSRDLGGAPNTVDARFSLAGVDAEKLGDFVLWPAQDGERAIRVWISIEGLSELSRVSFGINTAAINKALQTHRNYIERRAGEELNVGADEVELGVGALFPVR
jgi:hypothetical protein